MATPDEYQLPLSEGESRRLANRVITDYRNALADHVIRINRFRDYFRRWRLLVDPPAAGEEENSNFPVPVAKWWTEQKWSQNADSIFGDDAQIIAKPMGPSDYRNDAKISKYMTWRVFNYMKITNRLLQFELYSILFGRAHAYSPWKTESFDFETSNGWETNTFYKGPDFQVLEPDDLIVPAEDAETVHDFTFCIRKVRITPEQLLLGEERGAYRNIKKNFEAIIRMGHRATQRDYEGDEIKLERDIAEGVTRQNPLSMGGNLLMLEWYGRWRKIKRGLRADTDELDITRRELHQSELVVRILPDLANLEIGVQDLRRLYPACPKPRPFVERSYTKDGSYWCEGLMQKVIDIEDEVRSNHNKGTDAMDLVLFPPMLYRPTSGFDIGKFRYGPREAIPADNPTGDMAQVKISADLGSIQVREETLLAYGERLTGMSDMSMGRQPDRPNAPRTARGTMALLQQGNLRQVIDVVTLRQDYADVFQHFWILDWQFGDPETFFRVTEEDANGLFPVAKGGSLLSQKDRDGQYDFHLELATSQWSREADKENSLSLYQLSMQNPLIIQNPKALWMATKRAYEALGEPNFADIVPEPPTPDMPLNPKQEWSMIQQGETVHVNPMDNDQVHMLRHMRDLKTAADNQYSDQDAILAMKAHYVEHIHQMESKLAVQAIAQGLAQQASQLGINPAQMLGPNMGGMPTGILMPPGGTPLPPSPMPIAGSVAPINLHPFKGKQQPQQNQGPQQEAA